MSRCPSRIVHRAALLLGLMAPLLFTEVLSAAEPGVRRALILCGHPGDEEHRTLFTDAVARIYAGLTENLGCRPEHVTVYFGVEPDDEPPPGVPTVGPATRDAIASGVERLRGEWQPADALWVIVVGHAHYDGRLSWLNLPGPDLNQNDFARLFVDVPCAEQVFWIATPASGFYLKPLAAPGRVVITATEPDLELNATLMPHALADELHPTDDRSLTDADGDGLLTLFDLYVAVARNVARRYVDEALLATEHSLLDDNGDGRGTELQRDDLTEEEGGRPRRNFVPTHRPGDDGAHAATLRLPFGPVSALDALGPPSGEPPRAESSR
jgi:hypothetical protein